MPKLTVSIVLYSTPIPMIQKALNSVLNTTLDIVLFVIDNSPTNEAEHYCLIDQRVRYRHLPSNPGYGTAHNTAIHESIGKGAPYHLVMNPDVSFEAGVLEELVSYMDAHAQVGLSMPKVLYPDGSVQHLARLLPTPWDLFARRFIPFKPYLEKLNRRYELTFFDYDTMAEIPFLSGCFMFLRTETLRRCGLFDERFFMYLEDADLSRRIGMHAKTVYYPHVSIVHEYQRGSHRNFKLLLVFIRSAWVYFNKYGWWFDSYRTQINQKTLQRLGWDS